MESVQDTRQERGTRILSALRSSIASKGVSVALQLFAIPLIAKKLGPVEFGIYVLLAGLPTYVALADLGIGPSLARMLASAEVAKDRLAAAELFCSALLIALLGAILAGLVVGFGGPAFLHVVIGIELDVDVTWACRLLGALIAGQFAFSIGSKARVAYQEMHINNLLGAASNLLIIGCIAGVTWFKPTPMNYVLALFTPPLLMSSVNLGLLLSGRTYLLRSRLGWRSHVTGALLKDGIIFTAAIAVYGVTRELSKYLVALHGGVEAVGVYGMILQIFTVVGGLTVMVTGALWPGLNDAVARGDWDWVKQITAGIVRHAVWVLPLQFVAVVAGLLFLHRALDSPEYSVSWSLAIVSGALQAALVAGNFVITYAQVLRREKWLLLCAAGELGAVTSGFLTSSYPLHVVTTLWLVAHLSLTVGTLGSALRKLVLKHNL